jgi:PleD family two-component response regulator
LHTDHYLRVDLDEEFMRARRFSRDLAFILIEPLIPGEVRADMLYNVLKFLARSCEQRIRQIDKGVRWGQQILLVLPETAREGAERLAQKIRERFEQQAFIHPDTGNDIEVDLKTSILVYPHDGADKETILYNLRESLLDSTEAAPVSNNGAAPEAKEEGSTKKSKKS